jgi:hypothetical protein
MYHGPTPFCCWWYPKIAQDHSRRNRDDHRCVRLDPNSHARVMLIVRCIWVAAYASSAGPLGFVFLAECSTVLLRAKTANMGALANALSGLITTYCTPLMLSSPKFGVANTMFFFGCTGFLCVIALYFIIP